MRAQISNRDYEQLSAYIDGQLSPAERRKLEERLRARTDLQGVLDEMNRTRSLLRSAPRRRAPRNFTLTPAMVGERSRRQAGPVWNLFPVLSFTSALATLILVATMVLQILPRGTMATQVAMQPQQADRVEKIVQATMTAMSATDQASKPAAPQAPSAAEKAAPQATQAPAEATATEAGVMMMQPAPTETPAPSLAGGQVQATETPGLPIAAAPLSVTETPAEAAAAQPAATASQPLAAAQDAQATAPVIMWGNNNAQPQAGGYGGGGGGQGPSTGTLLGPPAAPDASSSGPAYGKGGGGGVTGPSEGIVIPKESVNSLGTATPGPEATTQPDAAAQSAATAEPGATSPPAIAAVEPPAAPAQPNLEINGPGPILGVPSSNEGGKIVEKKGIMGQPAAGEQASNRSGQTEPTGNRAGPSTGPGMRTVFGLPFMAVLQALLALVAISAGAAAYILRRQSK